MFMLLASLPEAATVTFAPSPTSGTYTVPTGVNQITIVTRSGDGGLATASTAFNAGQGATVTTVIKVVSGDVVRFVVGSAGPMVILNLVAAAGVAMLEMAAVAVQAHIVNRVQVAGIQVGADPIKIQLLRVMFPARSRREPQAAVRPQMALSPSAVLIRKSPSARFPTVARAHSLFLEAMDLAATT